MNIETIRQELSEKIKLIDPIGKTLKFDIDGDYMYIDGTGEQNIMHTENHDANCTVIMSLDTYLKLQNKQIKPMIATLKGKLKVKGDLSVARKLKQLR